MMINNIALCVSQTRPRSCHLHGICMLHSPVYNHCMIPHLYRPIHIHLHTHLEMVSQLSPPQHTHVRLHTTVHCLYFHVHVKASIHGPYGRV